MGDWWKWAKALVSELGPTAELLRLADHVSWSVIVLTVAAALFAPPNPSEMSAWDWFAHVVQFALWAGPRIGLLLYIVGLARRIAEHEDFI